MDELHVHQRLQVLWRSAVVRIHHSDDAQAGILNEALVSIAQTVPYDRPDATNHREVFGRHISAAVRGGLESSPLHRNREEVQVVEERGQAARAGEEWRSEA